MTLATIDAAEVSSLSQLLLAENLGTAIVSIRNEEQVVKGNSETILQVKREEIEFEGQLMPLPNELEVRKCTSDRGSFFVTAQDGFLHCFICDGLMVGPVVIDSGSSFCKACIKKRFKEGKMTCPVTNVNVTNRVVDNIALRHVISCVGGAVEPSVDTAPESSGQEGESSDANLDVHSDEPLEESVMRGLTNINSNSTPRVLKGLNCLIECTKRRGGRQKVSMEGAIPAARKHLLEMRSPQCAKLAVRFMEALTSSRGVRKGIMLLEREKEEIFFQVAEAMDDLIPLMKEHKSSKIGLLAAETVANILEIKEIRVTVVNTDGIVPAFLAFSRIDDVDRSEQFRKRANRVCVKGLTRMANSKEENIYSVAVALLKLVQKGLKERPDSMGLVRDSLVALESQVLSMGVGSPTDENICSLIRKYMSMLVSGLLDHCSVPGRTAILNIIEKMCVLCKNDEVFWTQLITETLILNTLKLTVSIGSDILKISEMISSSPEGYQDLNDQKNQLRDLKGLLGHSLRVLSLCVTYAKDWVQTVLKNHEEERESLDKMLVNGESSDNLDESRIEVLSILGQIDMEVTQATVDRELTILVKMVTSPAQACREIAASKIKKRVEERRHFSEIQAAGGVDALLALLQDTNRKCQQDALVALEALSSNIIIPADKLPLSIILDFLNPVWPFETNKAAVGLIDLVLENGADMVIKFLETRGALEATLKILERYPEIEGSQKRASTLLRMGVEDSTVRLRIAESGLKILVKYVRDHGGTGDSKELLTQMLTLCCTSRDNFEAIVGAEGHSFLVSSLQEDSTKDSAARGLLDLINNATTRGHVLGANFITTATMRIDRTFPSVNVALALATICSTEEGLDQTCACRHTVPALLTLLEHCPDLQGKASAAAIIARLFPRLSCEHGWQDKLSTTCNLLIRAIDFQVISQLKDIFEALAAIASETKGRIAIFELRGHLPLINLDFPLEDSNIQDLVLKILVELSGDIVPDTSSLWNQRIRNGLVDLRRGDTQISFASLLFPLVEVPNFSIEGLKSLLVLIRNLSLAGQDAWRQLYDAGAIKLLLGVLRDRLRTSSGITELAVKALEKFMDHSKGRCTLVEEGGVKLVAAVLKEAGCGRTSDAQSFATIILVYMEYVVVEACQLSGVPCFGFLLFFLLLSGNIFRLSCYVAKQTEVAKDSRTRKKACDIIFQSDVLSNLNSIIFDSETANKNRWQAAALMKLLVLYGPTSRVCSAMLENDCLYAVRDLIGVAHCDDIARSVLKHVSDKNKDCRKVVNDMGVLRQSSGG